MPRNLTLEQERRLNRKYCINEFGGGQWSTIASDTSLPRRSRDNARYLLVWLKYTGEA